MHRFRAKLQRIGLLRCVDVPARISHALGETGRMAVSGTAHGVPFRSTLIPRGGGCHRLYVHSRSWRGFGLDAGDAIEIALQRDDAPRDAPVPADFLRALDDRPRARDFYRTCGEGLRREIANWIAAAKQATTRQRRIEKALDALEVKAEKRRIRRVPR